MALPWYIGETKYAYSLVSAATGTPVISSGVYTIYDIEDESIVASGIAGISGTTLYCLWTPEESGIYVVDFDYVVGQETHTSRQVVEVKETM